MMDYKIRREVSQEVRGFKDAEMEINTMMDHDHNHGKIRMLARPD